jgi:exosortase
MKTKYKIIFLLLLWFAAFIPIYPSMFNTWINHSDNSHCILAPLFAGYFVFTKREQLKVAPLTNSGWGGFILILSMALYLLSFAGGIAVLSRVMIVSSLIGLILFNWGKEALKILIFPLVILFFMVPVPDSILGYFAFPLQLFATDLSTSLLQALSVPAYQEGNMVYFAKTQLEVAEACSGIRSIISFTMLSFIFAYFLDNIWWKRVVYVLSAIPLALFVNIIRITVTGVLADKYGVQVALGFLHEFSGVAIFIAGCLLLLVEYALMIMGKPSGKKVSGKQ